jgi:hypothetical protein
MSAGKENADPNLQVKADGHPGPGLKEAKPAITEAPPDLDPAESSDSTVTAPPEPPKDPRLRRRVLPNPIIDKMVTQNYERGVLIPLKTTQEVRQDHTIVQALITRAPTKSANDVIG